MGKKLDLRIEEWKKSLLDLGRRNRLINFVEGRRNNVKIIYPLFEDLWQVLVAKEKEVNFPYAKIQVDDIDGELLKTVVEGDVRTNQSIDELQKTLKSLRYKANTSIEEQGVNTLYLTFGMLKWKEVSNSSQKLSSPIILVPVKLLIESIISPYRLALHDDEIIINPTLAHKLHNDYGIVLPEFDANTNESPIKYLEQLLSIVEQKGWGVEYDIYLTNLSFLKINMYKDLERNIEKLSKNSIIAALAGEQEAKLISEDFNNFNHDTIPPIDVFQVVDADSSQQDAILLSKKGVSFVLQGPPGTGKSQTITNIIAEAIADGKKVLFVSEKMAALQVVYNRLERVGLGDFCLTLHSHKASKKEILNKLAESLNSKRARVKEEVMSQLYRLEEKRNALNKYQEELHTCTSGLNCSIYDINGKLAKMDDVPDVIFPILNPDLITRDQLDKIKFLLQELSNTICKRSEDYVNNVWRYSNIRILSNELRHDIDSKITNVVPLLEQLEKLHCSVCSELDIEIIPSLYGNDSLVSVLFFASKSPIIPAKWVISNNIEDLINNARKYKEKVEQIIEITAKLREKYNQEIFDIDAEKYKNDVIKLMSNLHECVNGDNNDWFILNSKDISSNNPTKTAHSME